MGEREACPKIHCGSDWYQGYRVGVNWWYDLIDLYLYHLLLKSGIGDMASFPFNIYQNHLTYQIWYLLRMCFTFFRTSAFQICWKRSFVPCNIKSNSKVHYMDNDCSTRNFTGGQIIRVGYKICKLWYLMASLNSHFAIVFYCKLAFNLYWQFKFLEIDC